MRQRLLAHLVLGALCASAPAPALAQNTALISNLASLRAAAADSTVTTFLLQRDITLDGSSVDITRAGLPVTLSAATYPCNTAGGQPLFQFPGQPPCPTVSAAGLSRALRITAGSLTLRGLQFTDGTGAPGTGGLVQATLSGTASAENLYLARASATSLGGALYIAAARATVTGVTAVDSSAGLYGGGIYVAGEASLSSIVISGTKSGYYAGALFVTGANNATNVNITRSSSFFGGGAIASAGFCDYSNLLITDCYVDWYGGAIAFANSGRLRNSAFYGNVAANSGGSLWFGVGGSVTGCVFDNNTATFSGGAIFISAAGAITDVSISRTSATNHGGAIYVGTNATLANVRMVGTSAARDGGGLYSGGVATLVNVTVTNSTAGRDGGAVRYKTSGAITASSFRMSSAGRAGGCIYGSGPLTLTSTSLTHCRGVSAGGGMSVSPTSQLAPKPSAAISSSSFTNCTTVGPSARGGALAADRTNLIVERSTFVGSAATVSLTAEDSGAAAVCTDAQSPAQFASGLGGAIYTSQSVVVLSDTTFEAGEADAGGGLFSTGGQLSLAGVRMSGNSARRGGAAVFAGDSVVSATASALTGNTATFGGAVMLLDSSALSVSTSNASANQAYVGAAFFLGAATTFSASATTITRNRALLSGGVAFTQSARQPPNLGADNQVSANGADNWGQTFATDRFTVAVDMAPSVRPGDPLPAVVTLVDGYGQPVSRLRDSSVVVTCPDDPAALKSPFINSYDSVRSSVAGLSLAGREGQNYSLVFTIRGSDIDSPASATVNVTVARCGFFEVFDPLAGACGCITGSERGADGFCQCPNHFYAWTSGWDADGYARASCRPCPSFGATCANGLLVPAEGFWHSSPESADIQACILENACRGTGQSSRALALRSFQRDALADSKHSLTLSGLAMAGQLDLREYQQLQCAEGYTGPLCGSCAEGYGRQQLMECRKCPPKERNDGLYSLIILVNVVSIGLTIRANILLSKGTRRPLYSQILKLFISYLTVASLCSRIAIKWPTAVLNLMRLQSVAANNVEVFSIDCSVDFAVESKVYYRALGWFLAFVGAAVVPALSLFLLSVAWRVSFRDTAVTVAFHRWGGEELRQLAQALLAPLPHEAVAWLAVRAPADKGGQPVPEDAGGVGTGAGACAESDSPVQGGSTEDEIAVAAQQSRASSASVAAESTATRSTRHSAAAGLAEQVWLPQLHTLKGVVHRIEAALDAKFVVQPHKPAPGPAGGQDPSDRAPLAVSWSDWLLEVEMEARCRGHLWQHEPARSEEDLIAVAFDYFVLTFTCIAFIIWMPTATAILQLFSCIRVDPRPDLSPVPSGFTGLWLLQDTSQKCFEGSHLRVALGVGVPGLIFVCVAFPLFTFGIVRRNRDKLTDPSTFRRYGFLYYGFKESHCFWEGIIMSRKLMIVAATVFLTSTDPTAVMLQLLACFAVIAGAFFTQCRNRPYLSASLTKLDQVSLMGSTLIVFVGLVVANSEANLAARTVLVVLVLVYNSYVFILFGVTLVKEIQRVMTLETARPGRDEHHVTDIDRRTLLLRVYPSVAYGRGLFAPMLRRLITVYAWQIDRRLHADADGRPPPLDVTRARVKRQLFAAVAVAGATERLRRTSLVATWATQGALRASDAEALAAYEARGRTPQALEPVARASEAHREALEQYRRLSPAARLWVLVAPRPPTAAAAEEAVEAALAAKVPGGGGVAGGAQNGGAETGEPERPAAPRLSTGEVKDSGWAIETHHAEDCARCWRFANRCVIAGWGAVAAVAAALGKLVRGRPPSHPRNRVLPTGPAPAQAPSS